MKHVTHMNEARDVQEVLSIDPRLHRVARPFLHIHKLICVRVFVRVRMGSCACVCARVRARTYVYVYVCVCVYARGWVSVCVQTH